MGMVRSLFPDSSESLPLEGLYLNLNLHRQAGEGEMLIYANFIASLDGRISRFNPETDDYEVPKSLANGRDWRLYQELAAQSDILITSARYFRQLSKGTAQDMLPVGKGFDDLKQWRIDQGLKAQPDVAILSRSLDIPTEVFAQLGDRTIYVMTSASASADKRAELESLGVTVMMVGEVDVEGGELRKALISLGFRSAYMIAGPSVHSTLINAGVLDRLFLTTRFTLLGSDKTHGFFEGKSLAPELMKLYLDEEGQQLFAQYTLKDEIDGEK